MVRGVVAAAIMEVLLFIFNVVQNGWDWRNLFSLCLSLLVPYCGYRGSLKSEKDTLMWFCGCNFFFAIMTIASTIMLWNVMGTMAQWCEDCEEKHMLNEECHGSTEAGSTMHYDTYCSEKYLDNYRLYVVVNSILCLPLACLYCYNYYYGKDLWRNAELILRMQNDEVAGDNMELPVRVRQVEVQPPCEIVAKTSPSSGTIVMCPDPPESII